MVYIICVLGGMIAGIILWEQIGVDDVYRGKFRFKQKGRYNRQQNKTNADMAPKKSRKDRRVDKKQNKD